MSESGSGDSKTSENGNENDDQDKVFMLQSMIEELAKNPRAKETLDVAERMVNGDRKGMDSKFTKQDIQDALLMFLIRQKLMNRKGLERTEGSTEGQSGPSTEPVPTAPTPPASTSTAPAAAPPTSTSTAPASPPTSAPPTQPRPPQSVPGNGSSQAPQVSVPNCRFHKWKGCNDQAKCKFKHPMLCQKFLWYGPVEHNAEHGCNRKECNLYHPPLCYGSSKFRECRTKGCKRRHLPQTKFTAKETKVPTKEVTKKQDKKPTTGANKSKHQQSRFSREPTPKQAEPEGIRSVPSLNQVTQGPPPAAASFLGPEAQSQLIQRLSQIERLLLMRQPVLNHPVFPQGVQFSY